jgi:hypothetical protein
MDYKHNMRHVDKRQHEQSFFTFGNTALGKRSLSGPMMGASTRTEPNEVWIQNSDGFSSTAFSRAIVLVA